MQSSIEIWKENIDREMSERTGRLDLGRTGLTHVPAEIMKMDWLRELILGNDSNVYPGYISSTTTENYGEPNSLNIDELIKQLYGLPNLITLALHDLKLDRIPEFEGMENLETLDLDGNGILYINFDPKRFPSLKKLFLGNNGLSIINEPERLKGIEILHLNLNKFTSLGDLSALENLKELVLTANWIILVEAFPPNLEWLDLSENRITNLEGFNFTQLKKLKVLKLAHNNIAGIKNIVELKNLTHISLVSNGIKTLEEMNPGATIKNIDLRDNELSDLTPLKRFLEQDFYFSLSEPGNDTIPVIYVAGNPLSIPSAEVIAQGNNSVKRYFATLEQTKAEQLQEYKSKEIKLILLGNSNVGKTHLASYLISNRKELPGRSISTHGMNFKKFTYNYSSRPGEHVTVRLFDFGGQEYYHDTHHLFFTEDTAYFLLWEKNSNFFGVTEAERYLSDAPGATPVIEKNNNFPVVYWLDAMNSIMKKKRVDFFGANALMETNTSDNTTIPIEVIKNKNVILVETKRGKEGETLINSNDFIQYEPLIHSTACLDLRQNNGAVVARGVNSLLEDFEEIIDKLVEKTWSAYFGFVNHFCMELRENPDKKEVVEKLNKAGILNKLLVTIEECQVLFDIILQDENTSYTFDAIEQVEDMCRFLANRGYIIYQSNRQICLYPQELTEKMYSILSKPQTGIINKKTIEEKSGQDCTQLLALMEEYRLLIPHTSLADTFIAPQNLPDTADDTVKLFLNSFQKPALRYGLKGYIHKNTILEIFFAFKEDLIKDVSNNYFWKNGLVIKMVSVNDLFKIEFVQNETERFITISSLNRQKDYTPFIPVEKKVEDILRQCKYEKEISVDGIDFIFYNETEKNARRNNAVFILKDKQYRVADYKTFLRGDTREYFMKKLFISYSSKDAAFMRRFVTHLEPLKRDSMIDVWHDRMIEPGARWDDSIKEELEAADIIVFLLSPDFIATSYVFDIEIPKALERLANNQSKIFLVLLNPCGWNKTDLKAYQLTLDNTSVGKDIITIKEPGNDEAWHKIMVELERKIKN